MHLDRRRVRIDGDGNSGSGDERWRRCAVVRSKRLGGAHASPPSISEIFGALPPKRSASSAACWLVAASEVVLRGLCILANASFCPCSRWPYSEVSCGCAGCAADLRLRFNTACPAAAAWLTFLARSDFMRFVPPRFLA